MTVRRAQTLTLSCRPHHDPPADFLPVAMLVLGVVLVHVLVLAEAVSTLTRDQLWEWELARHRMERPRPLPAVVAIKPLFKLSQLGPAGDWTTIPVIQEEVPHQDLRQVQEAEAEVGGAVAPQAQQQVVPGILTKKAS